MDWIDLAQDRERWGAVLNMVMKLRVPYNMKNFSTSRETVSFSKKTLLHGVMVELTRHNCSILCSIKISKCAEKLAEIRNRHIQLTFLTEFHNSLVLQLLGKMMYH
jgi:hypothetical protein